MAREDEPVRKDQFHTRACADKLDNVAEWELVGVEEKVLHMKYRWTCALASDRQAKIKL